MPHRHPRLLVSLALALVAAGPARAQEPAPDAQAEVNQAARELTALLEGHTDREEEGRVVALLQALSAPVLSSVLCRIDLDRLLEAVDDRPLGPDHRQTLLRLLCQQRAAELSVPAKAALLGAFQRGSTDAQEERAIHDLFLATRGEELGRLKRALEAGPDHHDLYHLIWSDLDDDLLRQTILRHLAGQAGAGSGGPLKVLSDIDDTLYANWKDTRYPSGTTYPGVRALYAELDRGPDEAAPDPPGDLVFVTARPGDRPGLVEDATRQTLRERGLPRVTVLPGDLGSLLGDEVIATRKLENIERYRRLFPEFRCVFLGDSGQGDASVGRALRQEPGRVPAVFIHDVVQTPPAERARWREAGVTFCDTWLGAACEAFQLGLISQPGLARVARAALQDFAAVEFADPAQGAARREELLRDLERANGLLPAEERVEVR